VGDYTFNRDDIINIEDLEQEKDIGRYSITYLGYHSRNKSKVHIKYIKYTPYNYRRAMKEIDLLEKLYENGKTSRYVARYYGSFLTETGLYIVTEYVEGINLFKEKYEHRELILTNPIVNWALMYQMILGIKFILGEGLMKIPGNKVDVILTKDNITKYVILKEYCNKECPKSNKNCEGLCPPSPPYQTKNISLLMLYYNLKVFSGREKAKLFFLMMRSIFVELRLFWIKCLPFQEMLIQLLMIF
jgi:hypothetical protein